MNILVPDSWLREHLKTKTTTKQIAKYLSLSGQSVEKIKKKGDDWIYEIEITTNRPDCLSVYGIARELAAILPRFNLLAKLKAIPEEKIEIPKAKKELPLEVKIKKASLCPRFTAIVFDNITIKPSPKITQERLEKAGARALNNVIDISNYLMLELGQPMHTFDYDKVRGAKMILRESVKGEKITTLDGQKRILPKGIIIIEDGERRIIDLCGIMGGANSEVSEKTKRVLLFVQTYDPVKIRQACQQLGFRTEAASRFEKGVNPEGVLLGIKRAVAMFQKNCGAKVASPLIDIYSTPLQKKEVSLPEKKLNEVMGLSVTLSTAKQILESLGFTVQVETGRLMAQVPHWRHDDINIPEDLIEEIARIYGYHNIPTSLPSGEIPPSPPNQRFYWESRIKKALKFWSFTEAFTYSMISKKLLSKVEIDPAGWVTIANPISKEWVYMRPTLIPSLLAVVVKNQALKKKLNLFEIANVYLYSAQNKLPKEALVLTGVMTRIKYTVIKGIVEEILKEMGITKATFEPYELKKTFYGKVFHPGRTAEIMVGKDSLGVLGEISPLILRRFEIKKRVFVFDLDFNQLVKHATPTKKYIPIAKYPPIIEDLTFVVPPKTLVGEMLQLIKSTSSIIKSVELIDSYRNSYTFRITYQSLKKNLSSKDIEGVRKKIAQSLKKKYQAKLKAKKI